MHTSIFFISAILFVAFGPYKSRLCQKQNKDVKITVIYDNYTHFEDLQGDWGFSCLIDQFRKHAVLKCGATHCTGDEAIRLFQEDFQENFLSLGAGKVVSIPVQGTQ